MGILGSGSIHLQGRLPRAPVKRSENSNSRCQKCLQVGHWTYECKNDAAFLARPSRSQQLKDPKVRQRFMDPDELPDECKPKSKKQKMGSSSPSSKASSSSDSSEDGTNNSSDTSSSSSSSESDSESGSSSTSTSGSTSSSSSTSSSDSESPSEASAHEMGTDWGKEEMKRSVHSKTPEKDKNIRSQTQVRPPRRTIKGNTHGKGIDERNIKRLSSKRQDLRSSSVESRGRWRME